MRRIAIFVMLLISCSLTASGAPRVGSMAPPLHLRKVLQSPKGAKFDWPSLRGKTVVLEFWATWCVHCIEEIPHLNQLAASTDPAKVVFIAIDDEGPKVIETYTARMRMSAWIGEDEDGKTMAAYGVHSRPMTVVVDPEGRIAAVTQPDALNRESLLAFSKQHILPASTTSPRKVFTPDSTNGVMQTSKEAGSTDKTPMLFELTVRSVPPTKEIYRKHSPDRTSWQYEGMSADLLWSLIYPEPSDRFVFTKPLPAGQFEMLTNEPGIDKDTISNMMQVALQCALRVKVQQTVVLRDVLVLKATPLSSQKLLPPVADDNPQNVFVDNGLLTIMNSTVGQMAAGLEEYLQLPVIDETHLTSKFDASLPMTSKDPSAAAEQLRQSLGMDVHIERRDVKIFIVSPIGLTE